MSEIIAYQPSALDVVRLKPRPDMLKVSGDQVFATQQGEGKTAGENSVFLRLQFCNLTCGQPRGWQCDTGYTWDKQRPEYWQEPEDWSIARTVDEITTAWQGKFPDDPSKRLVITGGEPLMQQNKIVSLVREIPDWDVEIETNGTIKPAEALAECQINCSPKLENSGNSRTKRYRPAVLRHINDMPDSQFKFVVTGREDFAEVDQIVQECALDRTKVGIMPEGSTPESMLDHASLVEPEALARGYTMVPRMHLIWFGSKRRT